MSRTTPFIRGAAFVLENYMGFPAGTATRYAERWISMPHTFSGFATVAAGVRLRSAIAQESMHQPLKLIAATTIAGQRVIGVQGRVPGP